MNGKLYRSPTDRVLGGVCGGIGAYLGIDPLLVRLFFVLLTIGGGAGVLIYVVLWIVVPEPEGGELASAQPFGSAMRFNNPQANLIVGAALVGLGLVFLVQNLGIVWMRWLNVGTLWPLLLVVAGTLVIWRRAKGA
jgi:phage shock protein C